MKKRQKPKILANPNFPICFPYDFEVIIQWRKRKLDTPLKKRYVIQIPKDSSFELLWTMSFQKRPVQIELWRDSETPIPFGSGSPQNPFPVYKVTLHPNEVIYVVATSEDKDRNFCRVILRGYRTLDKPKRNLSGGRIYKVGRPRKPWRGGKGEREREGG